MLLLIISRPLVMPSTEHPLMVKERIIPLLWNMEFPSYPIISHFHTLSGNREVFFGLDDNGRASIFQEPLNEIVRLLEQNLLTKFRQRCVERRQAGKLKM